MKKHCLIILLIQFSILKVAFCQINPLKFDAIVASELDSNLTTMLKWHIKKTGEKHKFTKNNFYVIAILPILTPGMGIPEKIIDSIYLRNVFPVQIDSPEYHVSIETEDKRNPYVRGTASFKNKYYFNYFGRDVFVISDLNIEIKNCNEKKSFSYIIDDNFNYEGAHTFYSYNYTGIGEMIWVNIK